LRPSNLPRTLGTLVFAEAEGFGPPAEAPASSDRALRTMSEPSKHILPGDRMLEAEDELKPASTEPFEVAVP